MTNLQDICVSLGLAKKLKEAGYPQESLFYWMNTDLGEWILLEKKNCDPSFNIIAAPTASELGKELPGYDYYYCYSFKSSNTIINEYSCIYEFAQTRDIKYQTLDESEANARAKMWLYLKKEGQL